MESYGRGFGVFSDERPMTSNRTTYRTSTFTDTDSPMNMELKDISGFRIINPIHITRTRAKDGTIYLKSKETHIFSYGKTMDEALHEFSLHLDFIWNQYVLCDIEVLHESAIPYREWLIDHFEKVNDDN